MTSKHYKWQVKWTIDIEALQARHESGLVIRFEPDGRGLRRVVVNGPEIVAALSSKNGPHNAPKMVERMAREADELMRERLAEAARQ